MNFYFLFSGLFIPVLLKPIHKVWMTIALLLGFLMTRVILTVLYYVVLSPLAILSKIGGKKYLDLAIEKNELSYWIYRQKDLSNDIKKENYEKQY